jgi:hypothetical protein
MPAANADVVIVSAGFTVRVNCLLAVLLALSCTWTVNVELTAELESVPARTPAALRVRPAGSEPAEIDQE